MFAKKTKYRVDVHVVVESIEQIPNAYVNGGGIRISYEKGKNATHKGETGLVAVTGHTMKLNESLDLSTKLMRDDKTNAFEAKKIVFKLKHESADGHKVKTLGTADVDLSQLATAPTTSTRISLQFAAKSQGKLKTKVTMVFESKWVKVGDKKVDHTATSEAVPQDGQATEEHYVTENALLLAPIEEVTNSELTDDATSAPDVSQDDDSAVMFETNDLDGEGQAPNGDAVSPRTSDAGSKIPSLLVQQFSPELHTITTSDGADAKTKGATSTASHQHSATMSELPDFRIEDMSGASTLGRASTSTGGHRTRVKSVSIQPSVRDSVFNRQHNMLITASTPANSTRAGDIATPSSGPVVSQQVFTLPERAGISKTPVELPFVSYVEKDGPELPDSAQQSLVYLAPGGFAIQSAAIAGDEVARLRAEIMDKNLKISLLGKQVEVLEKKTSELQAESERKDAAAKEDIAALEKKLKAARRRAKASEDGIDEDSTTSSGEKSVTEKKRKRKTKGSSSTRAQARQPFWTPEKERIGLLTGLVVVMLILVILFSAQVRTVLWSLPSDIAAYMPWGGSDDTPTFDQTNLQAPGGLSPDDPDILSASNDLSEAFSHAFSTDSPIEAPLPDIDVPTEVQTAPEVPLLLDDAPELQQVVPDVANDSL